MKKFLGVLICLFVLNACDDGDLTFDTFDFSEVQAAKCDNNNLVFKVNGNEALVIQINSTSTNDIFPFRNVVGTRTIAINDANKIFYRTFSGDVTSSYFCSTIPPVSPTVTTEYVSLPNGNGTIEIKTTLNPGATSIGTASYNHLITLRNVTFTRSDGGTIVYDELIFGTYSTPSQVEFAFTSLPVRTCAGVASKFFKVIDSNIANTANQENLNKIFEINIPITEFPTNSGDVARVFLNEANGVSAVYRIYNGDVSTLDYCSQVDGLSKYEEWKATDGINAVEDIDDKGYFEISSTTVNGQLVYTVNLRASTFNRIFPAGESGETTGTFTNTGIISFGTIILQ